jgi:hypothetical protein
MGGPFAGITVPAGVTAGVVGGTAIGLIRAIASAAAGVLQEEELRRETAFSVKGEPPIRPSPQVSGEIPIPLPITISMEDLQFIERSQKESARDIIAGYTVSPRHGYIGPDVMVRPPSEEGGFLERFVTYIAGRRAAPDVAMQQTPRIPEVPEEKRYPTQSERFEQMLDMVNRLSGKPIAATGVQERQPIEVHAVLDLGPHGKIPLDSHITDVQTKNNLQREQLTGQR